MRLVTPATVTGHERAVRSLSFVPLQGEARFDAATPPRESEIEFTAGSGGRVIRMPVRGAIPVLTRALRNDDSHPSVRLLSGATVLAMKLVAAGHIQLSDSGDAWRVGPLLPDDDDSVRSLARSRAYDDLSPADAEAVVRGWLDAVADSMTRTPSQVQPRRQVPTRRVAELDEDTDLPDEVTLALRIEAPEEQLAAGSVVAVLQVHEADNASHFTDALTLWTESSEVHGFGRRARTRAALVLREAALAWEPLGRLLREPIPDRIPLEGDVLGDLLEHGLSALVEAGVEVFWPRGLRAELAPQARVDAHGPREGPLMEGLFGPDALFGFDWRLALGDQPLSDDEMTALTESTSPVIKLRDNWMIVDPATARRARKRMGRQKVAPMTALQAALTGTMEVDGVTVEVHPGATLLKVRDRISDAALVSPLPEPEGLHASLRDYQRHGLTWLAELTGIGLGACLADDMGLGKTITLIALHLHRRQRGLANGPTLVVCPTSLLGNWETEIRRFAPGVAVRRFHGAARDLPGLDDGLRADDVRHHARRPRAARRGAVGPGRRRRGAAHQERRSPRPRATCARSRAAAGWR